VHLATDERAERFAGEFPRHCEVHRCRLGHLRLEEPDRAARPSGRIWRGVRQASAVIAKHQAGAVVGFGGYPTLPPLYAATRRKRARL
jgi:UDP-N-acetylglucosamine--N-acetylmuramyl-(pentapeptide) pyrophosphoryl-undecaprenol N-acetylglucosamine transferase